MRAPLLPLLAICAAGCASASRGVTVTQRDPEFELPQLERGRVAVWPVAAATLDPAAAQAVTAQYGSENAFLDSLGKTLSDRIVRPGGPPSLRSDQVVAELGAADETRPLLDSRRLLGTAESRFAGPPPELAKLGSLPALEGMRYAILLPDVSIDQRARGRLHAAVVDLSRGSVVWEGDLLATGTPDPAGMKRIEDGLSGAIADGLEASAEPKPRHGAARCRTNTECARAVCIDGVCQ